MKIEILKRDWTGFNHVALVKVDGETICALRQGGLNIWAFPGRPEKPRDWLDRFDAEMERQLAEDEKR